MAARKRSEYSLKKFPELEAVEAGWYQKRLPLNLLSVVDFGKQQNQYWNDEAWKTERLELLEAYRLMKAAVHDSSLEAYRLSRKALTKAVSIMDRRLKRSGKGRCQVWVGRGYEMGVDDRICTEVAITFL